MASPTIELQNFAQSIYLTIKNRYFDDISGEDGVVYVSQVVDWTNMFLDELENTASVDGQLVDWWFARENAFELGEAVQGEASIELSDDIDRLLTDETRYVQIQQDGIVVSNWKVVHPKDITNKTDRVVEDMCAVVGTNLVFSRVFKDTENNGTIVGDVVTRLPRISNTNVDILTTVRPKQLLILGVAKNATLPDIVQGGLSPSYVQKFNDLMTAAIARSTASSVSAYASRDNYSSVGGVY